LLSHVAIADDEFAIFFPRNKLSRLGVLDLGANLVFAGIRERNSYPFKEFWTFLILINPLNQILFFTFALIGLWKILKTGSIRDPIFCLILFTCAFILFLSLLAEVDPRYLNIVWGFICIFTSIGFMDSFGLYKKSGKNTKCNNWILFMGFCLLLACGVHGYAKILMRNNPYSLLTLRDTSVKLTGVPKQATYKAPVCKKFCFDFKEQGNNNQIYEFSWLLKNLQPQKQFSFNGFIRILKQSEQVVEVLINDKVIFSSATERKQFAKSKKNGKYLITFMHDLKFTAKEKNTLTLKFSNPGKDKVTYDASLLGVYVSPLTEKECKGNRNK
jgi:hypothetical protein